MSPRLDKRACALPFRRPLRTSAGRFTARELWLLRLEGDAAVGFGEVAPWPGFGGDLAACEQAWSELDLVALAEALAAASTPADISAALETLAPGAPAPLRHGLELAALDRLAQVRGELLAALLGGSRRVVETHALVTDAASARAAVAAGYATLKVKWGGGALGPELARLVSIREAVGDAAALRLDVNGGWSRAEARSALGLIARERLDLALVEQPLDALDLIGHAALRRDVEVPIGIDEGLVFHGVEAVIAEGAADVAVLKPMFLGGPLRALAAAERLRAAGLRVLVTNALESAVGRAGALHLAAALDGEAAGLSSLLAEDLRLESGSLASVAPAPLMGLPEASGLGLRPAWEEAPCPR